MRVVLVLSLLSTGSVLAISPGFPYGSSKVRGVSLGGWLVLEPWITPSIFDSTGNPAIVDEWTFGQLQSRPVATAALTKHWDTFITESDFAAIKAAGLNHVRVPIGYWAFELEVGPGEPYISGQLPYLNKAITWATNNGLKLIIDLHGAPGSQNGYDNSGHRMPYPTWHTNVTNVQRTSTVLKKIVAMVKDNAANVPAIQALNEPAGYFGPDVLAVTKKYWEDSFSNVRYPYGSARKSDTVLVIGDAFQPLSYWNGVLTNPSYEGVAIETHIYTLFSVPEVRMSEQEHINTVCGKGSSLASVDRWTIVGEWSPAMTDCAKYLNGRGIGSRYDGSYEGTSATRVGSCAGWSGSASTFSASYKTSLRKFWEAQVSSYEKAEGWIQWTWKTEAGVAEEWSYKSGLANGWIPSDPTNLIYPNICR
ncbi:Glycoside hydrolase family 5 protein [Mycena indigotica]|uniref:Glycoside hydrolase family 5 protein n=1 Tax=Mycena indigotica TaxID=2126181 RepID=A0A8H6VSX8_9AGAR|nr:Glycoside hydrolase family 5 protein [Mycena indigotica]KAF7288873.1 Glycoside hydrolase family 5 protein [Mycena indigotica]